MTMVHYRRDPASVCRGRDQVARKGAMVVLLSLTTALALWGQALWAQSDKMHYRFDSSEPPGAIGRERLARGGPVPGYFQPVEIRAPQGARISLAVQGDFDEPKESPAKVGLLIAPVYRLRISNIPDHEGEEVYPTIEVIDRLYPPAGETRRFPIPIEITQEDLELALDDKFVTRIVYLEDPEVALPIAERREDQPWFDVAVGVNPLEEADRWGRPLAIVRMGGRMPDLGEGVDEGFLNGSPPFTVFRPRTIERSSPDDSQPRSASRPTRPTQGGRTVR
jgi:hypothetical protein